MFNSDLFDGGCDGGPEPIYAYTLNQAIADGMLHPFAPHRWEQLSGGAPIVCTIGIQASLSDAAKIEIWNEFVQWRTTVYPALPEDQRLFKTTMNGDTVWVIEDGAAFTIMYPHEY